MSNEEKSDTQGSRATDHDVIAKLRAVLGEYWIRVWLRVQEIREQTARIDELIEKKKREQRTAEQRDEGSDE